ncbi:MAG TPA: DUF364 domain-containing protein [Chitinispirillaceae bacterium]|nr:DUF364 domain-containing protein [Chitinispirillaceae bacterium]
MNAQKNSICDLPKQTSPWELYDRLIDAIPSDLVIKQCIVGIHWIAVKSTGIGLSMTPPEGPRSLSIAGSIAGKTVREIASLAKSWKPLEAALGVAAMNSYYNAPSTLESAWGDISDRQSNISVFAEMIPMVRGKKVAVIGHFPDLGDLEPICTLSVLERKPQSGDLPDPACEYILPLQDLVFITGVTLINKTLIRLLELSRKSQTVLVGPSVPLTPLFMEYGLSLLAGTTVIDDQKICTHVEEGGDRSIFGNGAMMIR